MTPTATDKAPRSVDPQDLPPRTSVWRFEDGRVGVVASTQRSSANSGVVVYIGPQTFTVASWDAPLVFGRARRIDEAQPRHEAPAASSDATDSAPPPTPPKCHRADSADPFRALCGGAGPGDTVTANGAVECAACLAVMAAPSPAPDASRLSVAERRDPDPDPQTETPNMLDRSAMSTDEIVAELTDDGEAATKVAEGVVGVAVKLPTVPDQRGSVRLHDDPPRSGRRGKRERKS